MHGNAAKRQNALSVANQMGCKNFVFVTFELCDWLCHWSRPSLFFWACTPKAAQHALQIKQCENVNRLVMELQKELHLDLLDTKTSWIRLFYLISLCSIVVDTNGRCGCSSNTIIGNGNSYSSCLLGQATLRPYLGWTSLYLTLFCSVGMCGSCP